MPDLSHPPAQVLLALASLLAACALLITAAARAYVRVLLAREQVRRSRLAGSPKLDPVLAPEPLSGAAG